MSHPLNIAVGQQDGDIQGQDHRVLQAGLDYLASRGGGTLNIGPGTYHMHDSLHLKDNICIQGAGDQTVLLKSKSIESPLAEDADWYDHEIVLENAQGFEPGTGLCLIADDPHSQSKNIQRFTILHKQGNRLILDRQIEKNFWTTHQAKAATLFPILCGLGVENVQVKNLTLDGNREHNTNLDGNYGGGVFLQNGKNIHIESVTSQNYNGDGFSWQIVDHLHLINCQSLNHADLALHPGSGSHHSVIQNNLLQNCSLGIFFCWGVQHALVQKNRIIDCPIGISIGHRDTDNVVKDNLIQNASKVGLLFREGEIPQRNAHHNLFENNRFIDCAPADGGCVIQVDSKVHDVVFRDNQMREQRPHAKVTAIRIGAKASQLIFENNQLSGFTCDVQDLRPQSETSDIQK